MVVLVMYTQATRFLSITTKALFDAWPAMAEVEGIFEDCDMVFVEFSRGIVGFIQQLVYLKLPVKCILLVERTFVFSLNFDSSLLFSFDFEMAQFVLSEGLSSDI